MINPPFVQNEIPKVQNNFRHYPTVREMEPTVNLIAYCKSFRGFEAGWFLAKVMNTKIYTNQKIEKNCFHLDIDRLILTACLSA